MKERGILFNDEMVRALLAGTKTQTRRAVKPQPPTWAATSEGFVGKWVSFIGEHPAVACEAAGLCLHSPGPSMFTVKTPYGAVGDRLWVRECWQHGDSPSRPMIYRATDIDRVPVGMKWKPGIHLHRTNARLTLDITDVRVQRLHDISEEDARAEGVGPRGLLSAVGEYAALWGRINGLESWSANPWVWALTFTRAAP